MTKKSDKSKKKRRKQEEPEEETVEDDEDDDEEDESEETSEESEESQSSKESGKDTNLHPCRGQICHSDMFAGIRKVTVNIPTQVVCPYCGNYLGQVFPGLLLCPVLS
ncbi:VID27-like protein isoform X2 [Dipodomys merriami]|uniref:VID27-like protein isoform X2 n=1 Tax=Dipodomys merriami TaxID=94247 RepID=UPI003855DF0F